jgi:hypothetical protein
MPNKRKHGLPASVASGPQGSVASGPPTCDHCLSPAIVWQWYNPCGGSALPLRLGAYCLAHVRPTPPRATYRYPRPKQSMGLTGKGSYPKRI